MTALKVLRIKFSVSLRVTSQTDRKLWLILLFDFVTVRYCGRLHSGIFSERSGNDQTRNQKMKKESLKQFIKFGLVGVTNTLISQVVYMICVALGAHYLVASITAFIISVLNAYILQNIFVFKQDETLEKRRWWQVLIKTYIAYAFTGLLINNLLLILWIDIIKIERFTFFITDLLFRVGLVIDNHQTAVYIAPVLNIFVNVPINFVINKFWAYRQKKQSGSDPES